MADFLNYYKGMNDMVIGILEQNIVWEDKEANKEKIVEAVQLFVEKYKEMHAGTNALLLFPEMTLTGFSMNTDLTTETNRETVDFARMLAEQYDISIGIGWTKSVDTEDLCENHYSIVTPKEEALDYAKIHPFTYSGEDKFYRGGDHLSVCKIGDFNVGSIVCYDLRFPELFRKISDLSELIVVPANWPEARVYHWSTLLAARAIENQCYVAGINCVGEIGGIYYSGSSAMYDPSGKLVESKNYMLKDGLSKVMIYDLQNDVANIRKAFPVQQDKDLDKVLKMSIQTTLKMQKPKRITMDE